MSYITNITYIDIQRETERYINFKILSSTGSNYYFIKNSFSSIISENKKYKIYNSHVGGCRIYREED